MISSYRRFGATLGYHLVAAALALLFVTPLVWVLANSLRTVGLPPPAQIVWVPQPLAWTNYATIFAIVPLASYVQSSLWVGLLGMTITLITASLAGFAMAQLPPRPRQWLVTFAVVTMMAPNTAMWLARFVLFRELGLIDSYGALVAPALMG
ncbi:MAG: carbohydrate ABC transporter permease, partial [Caldilineaceae bacterium]|nr:carbohydrate ABC transporter permease [Caldilineaceae bacterium]MCB0188088.1 carbohydrate ABC transporter permease [Caldilineaceae bacterium]